MDFPGNSHNPSTPAKTTPEVKPELQKVVTGEVITRKKPLGKRVKELFFGGEFKGATRYITQDVMLPAMKNLIVEATSRGIERMIYGEAAVRRRPLAGMIDPRERQPRVSYNTPVERMARRAAMLPDQPPLRDRSTSFGEVILHSRSEAELVLETMLAALEKYDAVSVADFKELVGLPHAYTDNRWGWVSLAKAEIVQVREGYLMSLPAPDPI